MVRILAAIFAAAPKARAAPCAGVRYCMVVQYGVPASTQVKLAPKCDCAPLRPACSTATEKLNAKMAANSMMMTKRRAMMIEFMFLALPSALYWTLFCHGQAEQVLRYRFI